MAEKDVDPNDETEHKKLLEGGPPGDAIPPNPLKNEGTFLWRSSLSAAIPPLGIQGLKNKMNTTIRVSFKSDVDQLLISSSSSTQKVLYSAATLMKQLNFGAVTGFKSWPIRGHENYQ